MATKRTADLYLAYKITNTVNGRSYIGITGTSLAMRWGRHRRSALQEKVGTALARAIRKYGPDAFTMEPIAEARSWREACVLECELIAEHGTLHSAGGYNLTVGGDGFGRTLTVEQRAAIRKKTKERWANGELSMPPGQRAEMVREAHRRDPTYALRIAESKRGKRLDPKHRKALSDGHKKPWLDPAYRERMRPILGRNGKKCKGRPGHKDKPETILARVVAKRLKDRAVIEAAMGVFITGDPHTHCARGHPLDSANIEPSKDGRKRCRACRLQRESLRRQANASTNIIAPTGERHEQRQQPEPQSLPPAQG